MEKRGGHTGGTFAGRLCPTGWALSTSCDAFCLISSAVALITKDLIKIIIHKLQKQILFKILCTKPTTILNKLFSRKICLKTYVLLELRNRTRTLTWILVLNSLIRKRDLKLYTITNPVIICLVLCTLAKFNKYNCKQIIYIRMICFCILSWIQII